MEQCKISEITKKFGIQKRERQVFSKSRTTISAKRGNKRTAHWRTVDLMITDVVKRDVDGIEYEILHANNFLQRNRCVFGKTCAKATEQAFFSGENILLYVIIFGLYSSFP